MRKHIKFIIGVVIVAALVIGGYVYLSNRNSTEGKQENKVQGKGNADAAELIVRDLDNNYPESPREVLKLYAKITQLYYASDTTDEQVQQLGVQARKLFDDELKAKQTDEEFAKALAEDVANYRSLGRYIGDYKVDSTANFQKRSLAGREYSVGTVLYFLREGKEMKNVYHSYTMRKDAVSGRWKILYWEITKSKAMGEE